MERTEHGPGKPGLFYGHNKKPPTGGGVGAFDASSISLPIPRFRELKDWPGVAEEFRQGEAGLCS